MRGLQQVSLVLSFIQLVVLFVFIMFIDSRRKYLQESNIVVVVLLYCAESGLQQWQRWPVVVPELVLAQEGVFAPGAYFPGLMPHFPGANTPFLETDNKAWF